MSNEISGLNAPSVEALRRAIAENHRFSRGLIERAEATFGADWVDDFEKLLAPLFPTEADLATAARGYSAFAFDSMRQQKAFEESRQYKNKSYAEVAEEIYLNEQHMLSEYLPGLLLSHFLWPHHYRQIQFFDAAFLAPIRRSDRPEFAEVGIGTAVFSRRILELVPNARGHGYDISPSSCRYAQAHVAAIGAAKRYEVNCQDILVQAITPVPWLVCVEVLEHLENPLEFLRALRAALVPGGRAFITAAVNAAHADHIYLYRSAHEVEQQLVEAGFAIEQGFSASAFAPPETGVPVPVAAAFVVYPV